MYRKNIYKYSYKYIHKYKYLKLFDVLICVSSFESSLRFYVFWAPVPWSSVGFCANTWKMIFCTYAQMMPRKRSLHVCELVHCAIGTISGVRATERLSRVRTKEDHQAVRHFEIDGMLVYIHMFIDLLICLPRLRYEKTFRKASRNASRKVLRTALRK